MRDSYITNVLSPMISPFAPADVIIVARVGARIFARRTRLQRKVVIDEITIPVTFISEEFTRKKPLLRAFPLCNFLHDLHAINLYEVADLSVVDFRRSIILYLSRYL